MEFFSSQTDRRTSQFQDLKDQAMQCCLWLNKSNSSVWFVSRSVKGKALECKVWNQLILIEIGCQHIAPLLPLHFFLTLGDIFMKIVIILDAIERFWRGGKFVKLQKKTKISMLCCSGHTIFNLASSFSEKSISSSLRRVGSSQQPSEIRNVQVRKLNFSPSDFFACFR